MKKGSNYWHLLYYRWFNSTVSIFFTKTPHQGLFISALLTIVCLFFFGYFKSKATGQPPLTGAVKVTLIGITAAAAAYLVAKLFNTLF